MIADRANTALGLFDSITLSLIGMMIVFIELILLALFIILISNIVHKFQKQNLHPQASIPCGDMPLPPMLQTSTASLTSVSAIRTAGLDGRDGAVLLSCISAFSGIPLDRIIIRSIEKQ